MKLKTRIAKLEAHIQPTQKPTPDLSMLTINELRFLVEHIENEPLTKEVNTILKKAGLREVNHEQ